MRKKDGTIGVIIIKTYGRITIFANYTEKQLLSGNEEEIRNKVLDIMQNSIELHNENRKETDYLYSYYYGNQDIYSTKEKHTRTEIDNRTVENWCYAFIDFKKIQYKRIAKTLNMEKRDVIDSVTNIWNEGYLEQGSNDTIEKGYRFTF